MLRERWLTGLIAGVVVAVAIILFKPDDPANYRTEVSLLFSSRKDRVLNIPDVVDTSLDSAAELNIHLEQLMSNTFFEYLVVSFTPEETKRIQAPYLDPAHPERRPPSLGNIIRPNVNVYVRKATTIIVIAVTNRDPDSAALIANRYARKYIDYNLDRSSSGTNSAIVFLRNQADDLRRQVETAENGLQEYRVQHNLAALGENQNVIIQKISSLGNSLVKAQMDQIELATALNDIARYEAAHRPVADVPQVEAYTQVAQAKATLDTLRAQRVLLSDRYLKRHPRMKQNETEMADANRQLDEGVDRAVKEIRNRHDAAVEYERQLQTGMRAAEAQARELDKVSIDYKFLDQDVQAKRAAYARVMERLNEASISSQLDDINIRVFDRAWVATDPVTSFLDFTSLIAAGAGLLCFGLVPLGLGFFDTRVKTTAQVETALGQKLLGVLRRIPKPTEAERAQAFLHDTDGPLTESYRGLYGEIEVTSTLAYPKSLLVTSSVPNEGKSVIASNLASVFSSHGRRTLLVDCDLRRSSLPGYFQVDGRQGWIQWMQQPAAERPALPPAIVNLAPRLDLLPAGSVPTNCTQLLEQFSRAGVQKQLLAAYDLVIFDTPPATVFPDALLLARSCHEMIYVCLFSRVRMKLVRRAIEHLSSTGVHSLGVVLNQMPASGEGHGYYGYGTKPAKYYKTYGKSASA